MLHAFHRASPGASLPHIAGTAAAQTLDSTESLLEGNLGTQRGANDKAKEQYTRAAYGGCLKWILLLVVGLLFSWMVIFIRTFSDKVQ